MLGGESLLFNNLKTAADYNDDRLQVYKDGNKSNLVEVKNEQGDPINASMYDFSSAHNQIMEAVAFEQVNSPVDKNELEAMAEDDQMKSYSEKLEVHVAMHRKIVDQGENTGWYDWTTEKVSQAGEGIACVSPVVAVSGQDAVVVWQQGKVKFNDDGDRYIDGSLMLSRNTDWHWSEPVEIMRLNRNNIAIDCQVSMTSTDVLVAMSLKQDANNAELPATLLYLNVTKADDGTYSIVHQRYTQAEGKRPQLVHVNGKNLVGFLQVTDNGQDVVLQSVDMKGEPTGEISGSMGLGDRMVNDYRLVVDEAATGFDDVALLWTQCDRESETDGQGATTFFFNNRLYAAKLLNDNNQFYLASPNMVTTIPDDLYLISMDGYLNGKDLKVTYCVENETNGAVVMEKMIEPDNNIEYKVYYPMMNNNYDSEYIPIQVSVTNKGYCPITNLELKCGGVITNHAVRIMPEETYNWETSYHISAGYSGNCTYEVIPTFTAPVSSSPKKRNMAVAQQRRANESQTIEIRKVDIAAKVLNKRTVGDVTTIVVEVNNASVLPLPESVSVKVGIYGNPIDPEPVEGTTEVTINSSDLYDASTKENKVKIVTLTANTLDFDETLFLRTTPMENGEALTDVEPLNNILPVNIKGKYILGDVNGDGVVDTQDAIKVVQYYLQKNPENFILKAADVTKSGNIDTNDAIQIIKMFLKK
jgi:hypothetical protein